MGSFKAIADDSLANMILNAWFYFIVSFIFLKTVKYWVKCSKDCFIKRENI